ncbi:hypothetical protein K5549_000255 [Capra hircus]|nr:hypothetical protein K5549_000255 [Capra hircus]
MPWSLGEPKSPSTPGAGKKPVARRARESVAAVAVSGEDNDPNRDPVTKGQLTTDRPWPSCSRVHHGEPSSASLSVRGGQDSGNSEPVAMNKGEVMPRGPGPSGVIGGSAPTATLGVDLQANSLFCEVLFAHIALPASMQYLAEKFQIL